MKKVKKFVSILMATVMSICISTSLVSAEEINLETPILQNEMDGVPDDVIHIEFNPSVRMDGSGYFTFEFSDKLKSDYFTVTSGSNRIYLTPSSTVANDDFIIQLYESEDHISGERIWNLIKTYTGVANGTQQYATFDSLKTDRYYYFVLRQTGWFWDNGTISGTGRVTSVGSVHDFL